jgi:hypothetical protein
MTTITYEQAVALKNELDQLAAHRADVEASAEAGKAFGDEPLQLWYTNADGSAGSSYRLRSAYIDVPSMLTAYLEQLDAAIALKQELFDNL